MVMQAHTHLVLVVNCFKLTQQALEVVATCRHNELH